jgi:hypothetical protein
MFHRSRSLNSASIIAGVRRCTFEAQCLEPRLLFSSYTADDPDKVPWSWYQGVTAGFLTRQVAAQDARIVDLKVQTTTPLTFTAALVQNSGSCAGQWWWNYGQTPGELADSLSSRNARLVSLDPYLDAGNLLFASLMVPNSGPSAKSWWYYYGQSSAGISQSLSQNNGRLIDLEPYVVGGQTLYADVMIANTGADQQASWWAAGVDTTTIGQMTSSDSARVVSMSGEANGTFDAILEGNPQVAWWWYYGESAASLQSTAAENGARIFDADPYQSGGQTVFSGLMVSDTNSLEWSLEGAFGGATSGGETGAYLKQVDGPVLADYNGETQFEPASMIKIVLAATALQAVENGQASLSETVTYYFDPSDPTNPGVDPAAYAETPANAATIDLQDGIGQMLQVSDNRITYALANLFGQPAINAEAHTIGMTSTVWDSVLGSGVPGNYLTLQDDDLLYNDLLDGSLLNPAMTSLLESLIWNQSNQGLINVYGGVIDQQAGAVLGVDPTDPSATALANSFTAALLWGFKGGGYSFYNSDDTIDTTDSTDGGYFQLPVKNADGSISYKDFVYGYYLDNVQSPFADGNPDLTAVDNDWQNVSQTLTTGIITQALQTWVAGGALQPPAQVAFVQQPAGTYQTGNVSPAITIDVEDGHGNAVPFNDDLVTLSIAAGPAGATINGATTVQAVNGQATFDNVSLSLPGAYTLVATDNSINQRSAPSAPFTITAIGSQSAPAQLVFLQLPTDALIGNTISPAVTVAVEDPNGNILSDDSTTVTLAITSGALGGAASAQLINGVATFNDLQATASGFVTLTATDSGDLPAGPVTFLVKTPPLAQPIVPGYFRDTLPGSIVGGTALYGVFTTSITNDDPIRVIETEIIDVYACPDGAIDSTSIPIGKIVRRVVLRPQQQELLRIPIATSKIALAPGNYMLLPQVTDLAGNSADGTTGPALAVAVPFVMLSASIGAVIPDPAKLGGHASFRLTLTNSGNISAAGPAILDIGLSIDGQTEAIALTPLLRYVLIRPGGRAKVSLRALIPMTVPVGVYFPYVTLVQNDDSTMEVGTAAFDIVDLRVNLASALRNAELSQPG